ncbi:MAG TPA: hypothetical protein VK530_09920, partial [Candidatus Acidoferrum sp.]|nr:hypothetical protein [Candidatus Acidoferrum sp.]
IDTGDSNGGISALQYFAAGETATLLALQPAVREAMIKRLDPKAAEIAYATYAQSDTAKTLREWIKSASNAEERAKRQKAIADWIAPDAGYNFADLLTDDALEAERKRFISEEGAALQIRNP